MKRNEQWLGGALSLSLVLGLFSPSLTLAASTPLLGEASNYAVLGGTYTNTSAATTITGSIGYTTAPVTAPLGVHPTVGPGVPTPTARVDAGNALSNNLAPELCTFNFPAGPVNLSTDGPNGATGVYAPGVYCSVGAMNIGIGGINLTGNGTYLFRSVGALTSTNGSVVTLTGANVCDIFWTPSAATTLGANTQFSGTIIDNANAITVGANTVWNGRALSLGAGTVTTGDTVTITAPSCVTPQLGGQEGPTGILTLVKNVINDNGRTKTAASFSLFANDTPMTSGVGMLLPGNATYTITETADPTYTTTFSGDCDATGHLNLNANENKICLLTNNDIGAPVVVPPVPPLIDVVKVPSPLALPEGPGPVTYTYTLKNVGTVAVTDVTLVGDSCSPISLVSGDVNTDSKLDVKETWVYHCYTNLTATHTNTVVATGWANGLSATDIASATVVVGQPIIPPLIHVTKTPDPFTMSVGGGSVTYTKLVTNPGTVALSNVQVTDDKCSDVAFISGDANSDSKLDPSETWTYTCQTNLTATTVNTVIATGEANGLVARDFAIATVVVATAVPALPNTGLMAPNSLIQLSLALISALSIILALLVIRKQSSN